jgi:hypothetical protein
MSEKKRGNPYLTGNFAPVRTEDDFDLEVVGEIPEGLAGTLYRTGANPQFEPLDPNYHWFTGDGMVHAFRVGGKMARDEAHGIGRNVGGAALVLHVRPAHDGQQRLLAAIEEVLEVAAVLVPAARLGRRRNRPSLVVHRQL